MHFATIRGPLSQSNEAAVAHISDIAMVNAYLS
jgi:hypothetical protein